MVPQDTGWWWFWGKGLTQKGSAFLVDSFSPVISLCSFDVLGTSQDVGDGNNRPWRPCAEQTWGGKMQRTVQPCITEEFSSHSRAQCFSGARQASGQGRMCVHPRVSIYTGTAVLSSAQERARCMFVTNISQSCLSCPAEIEAHVLSLTERKQSTKVSIWL